MSYWGQSMSDVNCQQHFLNHNSPYTTGSVLAKLNSKGPGWGGGGLAGFPYIPK